MKKKLIVVGFSLLVLLTITILAWWWMRIHNQRQDEVTATASLQSKSIAPARGVPANIVKDVQETIAERQQKLWELAVSAPVTFYGEVVDEEGASIPNAQVTVVQRQPAQATQARLDQVTNARGLFSSPTNGMGLSVIISKKGYKTLTTPNGGIEPPHPDSKSPTVFVLKKEL